MQTDELADHLFTSVLGTLDVLTVHIGDQFGLYDLLHRSGPLSVDEVAQRSGMHPRYAREWLEQQAVAGLIDVDDPALDAESRRYSLSDEHAAVLSDPDSLSFFTPFARMVAAAAVQLPALQDAYRSGGGVGWETYGPLMRTAQAEANRPLYLGPLGSEWLPALPGCIATSRRRARSPTSAAARAGRRSGSPWPTRTRGSTGSTWTRPASTPPDGTPRPTAWATGCPSTSSTAQRREAETGGYDLVTAFECIHDMPDPVSVLANARRPGVATAAR